MPVEGLTTSAETAPSAGCWPSTPLLLVTPRRLYVLLMAACQQEHASANRILCSHTHWIPRLPHDNLLETELSACHAQKLLRSCFLHSQHLPNASCGPQGRRRQYAGQVYRAASYPAAPLADISVTGRSHGRSWSSDGALTGVRGGAVNGDLAGLPGAGCRGGAEAAGGGAAEL